MAKSLKYAIKRNGLYLHGIEPNKYYSPNACAPTMGTPHTLAEYRTYWAKEPFYFEPLTAGNYIKVIFEEYRWETKAVADLRIEVIE